MTSQVVPVVKNSPANAGDVKLWIQSLGREGSLEEDMALAFLPGESHRQRNLESYCPQHHKELNLTEAT